MLKRSLPSILSKIRRTKSDGPSEVGNPRGQQVNTSASNHNENIVGTNPVEIDVQDEIWSVKFFPDGKHVVSAGRSGKIWQWRRADGKRVGKSMNARRLVGDTAVSQDGKWIVAGTSNGEVTVWNATNYEKAIEFKAHSKVVYAVDISPDSTRIASASADYTLSIWSLATGQILLGPFEHDWEVSAVKFSPDGRLVATATYYRESIRIYDTASGDVVARFPIHVSGGKNGSLAWTSDGKQLFVLSSERDRIYCLDVSTWTTLSQWSTGDKGRANYIALTPNDRFIAASGFSSLSLWDAVSHEHLATVTMPYSMFISPIAISPNYDIVVAPENQIVLRNILDILPPHYRDNIPLQPEAHGSRTENIDIRDSVQPVRNASRAIGAGDQLTSSILGAQHDDTNKLDETVANVVKFAQGLRDQLATANEEKERLRHTIQSLRAREENSTNQFNKTVRSLRADLAAQKTTSTQKIANLEKTVQELTNQLAASQRIHEQKHQCETMFASGHIYDAAKHLLEIINSMNEDLEHNELIMNWLESFRNQCISRFRAIGDEASITEKNIEAFSAYSAILSLTPSPPNAVLMQWARTGLRSRSANEVLEGTDKLMLPKFTLYRAVCDALEEEDYVMEAIRCFQKIKNDLSEETYAFGDTPQWERNFRQRCVKKLEDRASTAMDSNDHDTAIGYYSSALSLDPMNINNIIVKCCTAWAGLLEEGLVSASKVIEHDPSNYKGYQQKYSVLHSMGRYREAFSAFEIMLLTLKNSADPQACELRSRCLDTTPFIRETVDGTIRDIPRVLIDTITGRLYDKTQQAAAFEELLIFDELRSIMTTHDRLDHARIKHEVEIFYQYVMFSHRWQPPEPTFQMVEDISIYQLPESPTIKKLIHFCNVVQSRRFRWAWSDTCCVNQADKGVQQESVVAMFRWYSRAALTIVHLLGILSDSQQDGDLWRNIWNTRGWTYQEYVASRVIRFYTEDWKPYLGLDIYNHKESSIILSEMEQATKFATEKLATLQPGLDRVREKLYLASRRQTTREEDIAYSLFGIFDVSLPVIYGEGKRAVRRLLEHILTQSDEVTLLSWTGDSDGTTKSYLPSDLTVYNQILPPHVPQAMEAAEMDRLVMDLQSSCPDASPIVALYKRLLDLPSLSFVSGRLRLTGLVFRLTDFARLTAPGSSLHIYRAKASILGEIRIETKDDSLGIQRLVLVHPWISPLLDEDFSGDDPLFDLDARALRMLVRLRQPFGALLLASQKRGQYKRVATDSFIRVQIQGETSSSELVASIDTVDVQ